MSASSDDDPPEKVGYGKPPKSGQFRKGRSGNPNGRPRKKQSTTEWPAARYPTREALRAEAARRITVNDASGRHEIATTQAVVRALALNALRGGVLAQRAYLEYQKSEDERYHRERNESFEFWLDYKERKEAEIAVARASGKPEPTPLPHPVDIEFDWENLRAQFFGPMNREQLASTEWLVSYRNLCFVMSHYLGEEVRGPSAGGEEVQVGSYFALFLIVSRYLPRRWRPLRDADMPTPSELMHFRATGGEDLRRRCNAVRLHFVRWKPRLTIELIPISSIGFTWPQGVPFPAASPVKATRSRRRGRNSDQHRQK